MKDINNFIQEKLTINSKSKINQKIDIGDSTDIDFIIKSIFPIETHKEFWSNASVKTNNWKMFDSMNVEIQIKFDENVSLYCKWYGKSSLRIEHCNLHINDDVDNIPQKYKKYFNKPFNLLKEIDQIKTESNSNEKINGPTTPTWGRIR